MDIKETNDYEQFVLSRTPLEREQYIISQALYFGIKTIQAQPPPFQEIHNMWDMADLFNNKYPDYKGYAKQVDPEFDEVMKSGRRPPDLHQVK